MSVLQINVLQEVYDHITDYMLYYTEVPAEMFAGIDDRVTLQYPAQFEWADTEKAVLSPAHLLAARFGDIYLDELVDHPNITPADIIDELRSTGLKRLTFLSESERIRYASQSEKDAIATDLISMVIEFETVFSSDQPIDKWAERFVQIAKLHFLRWDRPFIARKLLPEVPEVPVEPIVETRTAALINNIEIQGYKPVVEELGPKGPTGMPGYYADHLIVVDMTQPTPSPDAQEILDRIRSRQEANANSTLTQQVMDKLVTKKDTFFDFLGGYFTFVTELPNPTLKYGQLTKKEVVYSIDNPDGDVHFVFEVIDDRGYIEPVRVNNLEKSIVCKGDQIHYKDFNKVVKAMLARVQ